MFLRIYTFHAMLRLFRLYTFFQKISKSFHLKKKKKKIIETKVVDTVKRN
jgi:hypothetical protein